MLCGLIPGGISKAITAGQAARVLDAIEPAGAVALARRQLAAEFLDDLRRIDAQIRQAANKLTAAVRASGTTLTQVYGAGPVIAAIVPGCAAEVSRFTSRDQFGVGQLLRMTRAALAGFDDVVVDQHIQCRQEGVEVCSHERPLMPSSHFMINSPHRNGPGWESPI